MIAKVKNNKPKNPTKFQKKNVNNKIKITKYALWLNQQGIYQI